MGWRGGEFILLFCFQYWSLAGKKIMLYIQKLHQWWKSVVDTLTDETHHNTHSFPAYLCTVCCYMVPGPNFWSPINFKVRLRLQEFSADLTLICPSRQSEDKPALGPWSVPMLYPDYLVTQAVYRSNPKAPDLPTDSSGITPFLSNIFGN